MEGEYLEVKVWGVFLEGWGTRIEYLEATGNANHSADMSIFGSRKNIGVESRGSIFRGGEGAAPQGRSIFGGQLQPPTGNISGGGNIFGPSNLQQPANNIFSTGLGLNLNTTSTFPQHTPNIFSNPNNYSNEENTIPSGIPYIQPDYSDPHGTRSLLKYQVEREAANEAAYKESEGLLNHWESRRKHIPPVTLDNIPQGIHEGDGRNEIKSSIVYPGEPIQFDAPTSNFHTSMHSRGDLPHAPYQYYTPDPLLTNHKSLINLTLPDYKENKEDSSDILYIYNI